MASREEQRQKAVQAFISSISAAAQALLQVNDLRESQAPHGVKFEHMSQEQAGFIQDNGRLTQPQGTDDWHVECVASSSFDIRQATEKQQAEFERMYPDQGGALLTDTPSILFATERMGATQEHRLTWNEAYQLGYALMRIAEVSLFG